MSAPTLAPGPPTISVVDAVLGCAEALHPVKEPEGQQNRGYFVDAINTELGSPLGSAWCLNGVLYVLIHVLGREQVPIPLNGNCDVLLRFARKAEIIRTTPARGYIFLKLDPQNPSNATHAGFVRQALEKGTFRTREYNSNDTGSSNGERSVSLVRPLHLGERYTFVEWAALLHGA